ncbi:MAG: CPBP family intramembrane metalloprotease [Saprospiraceae bacterium]|nr:CPBP family intramembrane metalloprotease [Saprospiraceae bacterium]
MDNELGPFWSRFFSYNWKFGLFLILIICIPRFILVLNANSGGNNGYIGLIMTISAIAPFLFLTKFGRNQIGITKPLNYKWLFIALVGGLIASLLLNFIGQILYYNSFQNWYQYIGKSMDKSKGFAIIATMGMIFSPIGEELFFRGLFIPVLQNHWEKKKASIVDSSAFALTHISHFGLVFINNTWDFYFFPTIIWVSSMFLVSLLFFTFRKKVGSILGAIVCHAAFNFGMTYSIFYLM